MLNKMMAVLILVVMPLAMPSKIDAYGAAHVGYTHVGPGGVQHYGASAYHGPNASYAGAHRSAYGTSGGVYHAGYGGAAVHGSAGSYHYAGTTHQNNSQVQLFR